MNITMEHIAKRANVAQSTVSLVVNNKGYVSEDTREKVQKVIDELNFRSHVVARELVLKKSENIAFILILNRRHLSGEPFFTKILEGVDTGLQKYGYRLVFVTADQRQNTNNGNIALNLLKEYRVRGVIIGGQTDDEQIRDLRESKFPVVLLQRGITSEKVSSLSVDDANGAYDAVNYLISLGHRRIAFIGKNESPSIIERFEGYKRALEDKGIEYSDELVINTDKSIAGGYLSARKMLKKLDGKYPTAVFAVTDQIAIGAMRAIKESGLQIPKDVSIVGFDDIEISPYLDPPLTTVRVFKKKMGALAVRMLIEIMHKEVECGSSVVVPAKLVIRKSCAAAR